MIRPLLSGAETKKENGATLIPFGMKRLLLLLYDRKAPRVQVMEHLAYPHLHQ
jgi:hypothetical protein